MRREGVISAVDEHVVQLRQRVCARNRVAGGVLACRAEHGHQHRDAEGAAELLGDIDQTRRGSGILRGDTGERGRGQRHERQPVAGTEEHQAGEDLQSNSSPR